MRTEVAEIHTETQKTHKDTQGGTEREEDWMIRQMEGEGGGWRGQSSGY